MDVMVVVVPALLRSAAAVMVVVIVVVMVVVQQVVLLVVQMVEVVSGASESGAGTAVHHGSRAHRRHRRPSLIHVVIVVPGVECVRPLQVVEADRFSRRLRPPPRAPSSRLGRRRPKLFSGPRRRRRPPVYRVIVISPLAFRPPRFFTLKKHHTVSNIISRHFIQVNRYVSMGSFFSPKS